MQNKDRESLKEQNANEKRTFKISTVAHMLLGISFVVRQQFRKKIFFVAFKVRFSLDLPQYFFFPSLKTQGHVRVHAI